MIVYQRKINIDTLKEFGCGCVYSERISGVKRTELVKCLDYLRESDTLVVYQLDRLGRTTKLLIELSQWFDDNGIEHFNERHNGQNVFYDDECIFQD